MKTDEIIPGMKFQVKGIWKLVTVSSVDGNKITTIGFEYRLDDKDLFLADTNPAISDGWNWFDDFSYPSTPCQLLVVDPRLGMDWDGRRIRRLVNYNQLTLIEENGREYTWINNPYTHWKIIS